jgi:hypothetical protein
MSNGIRGRKAPLCLQGKTVAISPCAKFGRVCVSRGLSRLSKMDGAIRTASLWREGTCGFVKIAGRWSATATMPRVKTATLHLPLCPMATAMGRKRKASAGIR